jgi:Zinc finger, C2H2 type.
LLCSQIIAQAGNCIRHLKTHNPLGEGEHECPICGKKFNRIDYIERHLKQHGKGSTEEVQKMIKLLSAGMKKN